jgi:CTP:molybdopterin cytidylyltransferase MocA
VAVVLAGGESRRFGSDKLAATLDGRSLLEVALDGLPSGRVAIVGPARPMDRVVTFVREDPPGGGPAAGLIVGLEWALEIGAERILTLPGDAPGAGRAANLLLAALTRFCDGAETTTESSPVRSAESASAGCAKVTAAVGVDVSGRQQVLQLALCAPAARALIEAAGSDRGRGQSVRRLLANLTPTPLLVPLPEELTADIDTVDQLGRLRR